MQGCHAESDRSHYRGHATAHVNWRAGPVVSQGTGPYPMPGGLTKVCGRPACSFIWQLAVIDHFAPGVRLYDEVSFGPIAAKI